MPNDGAVRGVVLADQARSLSWEKRYVQQIDRAPATLVAEVRERIAALLDIAKTAALCRFVESLRLHRQLTPSMRKRSEGEGCGHQTDQEQARLQRALKEIEGLMHAKRARCPR